MSEDFNPDKHMEEFKKFLIEGGVDPEKYSDLAFEIVELMGLFEAHSTHMKVEEIKRQRKRKRREKNRSNNSDGVLIPKHLKKKDYKGEVVHMGPNRNKDD